MSTMTLYDNIAKSIAMQPVYVPPAIIHFPSNPLERLAINVPILKQLPLSIILYRFNHLANLIRYNFQSNNILVYLRLQIDDGINNVMVSAFINSSSPASWLGGVTGRNLSIPVAPAFYFVQLAVDFPL